MKVRNFKKRFYRFLESILKKIILFFKKTKNQNLSRSALSAIYRTAKNERYLLKNNANEVLIVHTNELISEKIFIDGSFEFLAFERTIAIIKKFNKLNTLVDIGANIGTTSIPALTKGFFKNAIVIEPEIKNFRILMSNIYLNNLEKRITAHNLALTDKENSLLYLEIFKEGNNGKHKISKENLTNKKFDSENIQKTKGNTLDKIAPNITREDSLIWMDAEGYEGIILKGANSTIVKKIPLVVEFDPVMMSEYHSFNHFKLLFPHYSVFYDLSHKTTSPIKLDEETLKENYDRLLASNSHTDLLFI